MTVRILEGDVRARLADLGDNTVHCIVTSPPYFGLRDYDCEGQIGLEKHPSEFIDELVRVFRECRRVLRKDGTLWLNMGDSYAGSGRGGHVGFGSSTLEGASQNHVEARAAAREQRARRDRNDVSSAQRENATTKRGRRDFPAISHDQSIGNKWVPAPGGIKQKDLIGIPWMLAFALRADGWFLRSCIIWHKPNPMPESAKDRPTTSHEYVFLMTKSPKYFYDRLAIAETASELTNPRTAQRGNGGRPTGWADSDNGDLIGRYTGTGKKGKQNAAGSRQNESFLEACSGSVTAQRNKRSVWTIPTFPFPEAHFATFPPDLVDPCVRAGSSEHGACARCGAPWGRIIKKVETGTTQKMPDGMATHDGSHGTIHKDGREKGETGVPILAEITVGWRPNCKCDTEERVPCTVLDPFGGSGTTALVADRLQRDAILIELNPTYAAIARHRIQGDAPIFTAEAVTA